MNTLSKNRVILSFLLVLTLLLTITPAITFGQVIEGTAPAIGTGGCTKWAVNPSGLSGLMQKGVTPPVLEGDYIFTACDKTLYKMDKANGKIMARMTLEGSTHYGTLPVTVADGKIFVPLFGGKIEAVDAATMEKIWTASGTGTADTQTISPITYKNGRVYCGTWSGVAGQEERYFCLQADTGELLWQVNSPAGFYWAGAYVTEEDVAIFGSQADETGKGKLYVVDKTANGDKSGKVIDTVSLDGSICCTPVYQNGSLYVTTKGAKLYRIPLSLSGSSVEFGNPEELALGAESTNTPQIYNEKLYVGDNDGHIHRIDLSTFKEEYKTKAIPGTYGAIQGELLLITNGTKPVIYNTYNSKPGGIYYTVMGEKGAERSGHWFTPKTQDQEYCISSIAMDKDGVIYYKNDTNKIFAVTVPACFIKGQWVSKHEPTYVTFNWTGTPNNNLATEWEYAYRTKVIGSQYAWSGWTTKKVDGKILSARLYLKPNSTIEFKVRHVGEAGYCRSVFTTPSGGKYQSVTQCQVKVTATASGATFKKGNAATTALKVGTNINGDSGNVITIKKGQTVKLSPNHVYPRANFSKYPRLYPNHAWYDVANNTVASLTGTASTAGMKDGAVTIKGLKAGTTTVKITSCNGRGATITVVVK